MNIKIFRLMFVLILVLLMFVISGCMGEDGVSGRDGEDGEDGEDGKAAIAYSWLFGSLSYWTEDPGIGSTITNGTYYTTIPGQYNYMYESWDGTIFIGFYYIIYINEGESGESGEPGEPGEPGELFKDGADGKDGEDGEDGEDGADMCFEVTMYSIGPTFYERECSSVGIDIPRSKINSSQNTRYKENMMLEEQIMEQYQYDVTKSEEAAQNHMLSLERAEMIIELNNNPNTVVESGSKGQYNYIHKYLKISD